VSIVPTCPVVAHKVNSLTQETCWTFSNKALSLTYCAGIRGGGAGPFNVNLGSPDISETTRARKLNLKILLDVVKCPLWVQKLFYYTIQHEGGRHIDFQQKSLRQTMANNCKTTFSLHVVESASDGYIFQLIMLCSKPWAMCYFSMS